MPADARRRSLKVTVGRSRACSQDLPRVARIEPASSCLCNRRRRRDRPQPLDFLADSHRGAIDLLRRRVPAEADPERALRQLVAATQRPQDVRRLPPQRGACRARGEGEVANASSKLSPSTPSIATLRIRARRQLIAVQPDAGQIAKPTRAGRGRRADACGFPGHLRAAAIRQASPMPTIWCVRQRSGAQAPLLSTAEDQRHEPEPRLMPDAQRAYSFRSIELVGGERQQVDRVACHVELQLACTLRGVHVQQTPARAADAANLAPRPCTTPVSLLTCISETRIVSGRSAASTCAGSTMPPGPGRRHPTFRTRCRSWEDRGLRGARSAR